MERMASDHRLSSASVGVRASDPPLAQQENKGMNDTDGRTLALAVRNALPWSMLKQLKAIHVSPHLHNGHLTIRVFMIPVTAADPEPFVFSVEDLDDLG